MAEGTMPYPQSVDTGARPTWLEVVHDWVTTVDHKKLGIMYIVYALLFLVVGGVEALLMRIQLAAPHLTFISPQTFNRMFTMHGTTMVFLMECRWRSGLPTTSSRCRSVPAMSRSPASTCSATGSSSWVACSSTPASSWAARRTAAGSGTRP